MMIYTIIFDWGSVLAPDDSLLAAKYLSDKYSIDYDSLLELLENEDPYSVDLNYNVYFDNIFKAHGIPKEEIIYWKQKPGATFEYCKHLYKDGYCLYLLSDQVKFKSDYIRNTYDLRVFDDVFFSSEIGYLKKSRKSFEFVVDKTCIVPEQTIFIDDDRQNIAVACSLGFVGILFENLVQLQSRLLDYGIQ